MKTLAVLYARNHTLASLLIRNADSGRIARFSHCALLTDTETVIEARARQGVVETPLAEFMGRYSHVERVDVNVLRPDRGLAFARAQVGKGYDWGAALGALLREDWAEEDRWHCAELVEACLVKAGRRRFREGAAHIRPNHSFMVF